MINITTTQNNALAISEGELMGVLRNSLYPGAKARRFMWKAASAPANGPTSKAGKTATAPKSASIRCKCWAANRMAQQAKPRLNPPSQPNQSRSLADLDSMTWMTIFLSFLTARTLI